MKKQMIGVIVVMVLGIAIGVVLHRRSVQQENMTDVQSASFASTRANRSSFQPSSRANKTVLKHPSIITEISQLTPISGRKWA
jgi:uncharacterized protein YxeA